MSLAKKSLTHVALFQNNAFFVVCWEFWCGIANLWWQANAVLPYSTGTCTVCSFNLFSLISLKLHVAASATLAHTDSPHCLSPPAVNGYTCFEECEDHKLHVAAMYEITILEVT